jgi:hypothetical protein
MTMILDEGTEIIVRKRRKLNDGEKEFAEILSMVSIYGFADAMYHVECYGITQTMKDKAKKILVKRGRDTKRLDKISVAPIEFDPFKDKRTVIL